AADARDHGADREGVCPLLSGSAGAADPAARRDGRAVPQPGRDSDLRHQRPVPGSGSRRYPRPQRAGAGAVAVRRARFSIRAGQNLRGPTLKSEPVVGDATAIARQVLEGIEAVEVVDRNLRDSVRLCEPQVDGNPPAALFVDVLPAPERDAAAGRAEIEAERLAADERLRRPRYLDSQAFEVIRPQRAVTAASRAITRRRAVGNALESPSNCATNTRTLDHLCPPMETDIC